MVHIKGVKHPQCECVNTLEYVPTTYAIQMHTDTQTQPDDFPHNDDVLKHQIGVKLAAVMLRTRA